MRVFRATSGASPSERKTKRLWPADASLLDHDFAGQGCCVPLAGTTDAWNQRCFESFPISSG
eukprot:4573643-Pyramimonas_sp.AAC.1